MTTVKKLAILGLRPSVAGPIGDSPVGRKGPEAASDFPSFPASVRNSQAMHCQTQDAPETAVSDQSPETAREVIFDLGMHNGDDSAYYLHLGYSVVGVDANPLLTAACASRFRKEIREGRMEVVNAGVLNQSGSFTFYRNLHDEGWSSFDPERGKARGKWEALTIPCVTIEQLIASHGKPVFIKIDIEGADFQALESMTPAAAPHYISVELSYDDPIVESLIALGYSSFKFVDGEQYRSATRILDHQHGWRILRKIGRTAPPVRNAIRRLPERMRPKSEYSPPGKYSPDGYAFTRYSSGPFGEQAAGRWRNGEDALRWFAQLKRDYRRANAPFWWDVHARHGSAPWQHSGNEFR